MVATQGSCSFSPTGRGVSLAPQLESAVVKFKAIRDELDPSHEALIALVEHEEALLSFSRQEIAGHGKDGLKGLRSYVAKYGKTM